MAPGTGPQPLRHPSDKGLPRCRCSFREHLTPPQADQVEHLRDGSLAGKVLQMERKHPGAARRDPMCGGSSKGTSQGFHAIACRHACDKRDDIRRLREVLTWCAVHLYAIHIGLCFWRPAATIHGVSHLYRHLSPLRCLFMVAYRLSHLRHGKQCGDRKATFVCQDMRGFAILGSSLDRYPIEKVPDSTWSDQPPRVACVDKVTTLLGEGGIEIPNKVEITCIPVVFATAEDPECAPVWDGIVFPITGDLGIHERQALQRVRDEPQAAFDETGVPMYDPMEERVSVEIPGPEGLLVGGAISESVLAAQTKCIGTEVPDMRETGIRTGERAALGPWIGSELYVKLVDGHWHRRPMDREQEITKTAPQERRVALPPLAAGVAQGIIHLLSVHRMIALDPFISQHIEDGAGGCLDLKGQPANHLPSKIDHKVRGLAGLHWRAHSERESGALLSHAREKCSLRSRMWGIGEQRSARCDIHIHIGGGGINGTHALPDRATGQQSSASVRRTSRDAYRSFRRTGNRPYPSILSRQRRAQCHARDSARRQRDIEITRDPLPIKQENM